MGVPVSVVVSSEEICMMQSVNCSEASETDLICCRWDWPLALLSDLLTAMYNKTESEISLANKMKQNCDNDPALSHNSKVAAATITKKTKAIIVFINLRAVSEKEVY